jgi:hypothetical protein
MIARIATRVPAIRIPRACMWGPPPSGLPWQGRLAGIRREEALDDSKIGDRV